MADFCTQCSLHLFGEDFGDFANLSTEADTLLDKFAVVICEGCGPILVDHTGKCVSEDCLENHHAKEQADEMLRKIRAI